eukprot:10408165-Heterocapsa_arctica.AAC.1
MRPDGPAGVEDVVASEQGAHVEPVRVEVRGVDEAVVAAQRKEVHRRRLRAVVAGQLEVVEHGDGQVLAGLHQD